MTRLTQEIRGRIASAAIDDSFRERGSQIAKAEHALGMECYRFIFPVDVVALVNQLPDGWARECGCLRFNANGYYAALHVEESVRTPHSKGCSDLGSITGELGARVQAHIKAKEDHRTARARAERELLAFLESFTTLKKLREAWPQGEAYYSRFETEPKASGVPAIRVQEINALLGISPELSPAE